MSGARTPARPAWLEAFPSAQVRELDPRRHALVEASAGTGKTFAIEHLVLRLLVENPDWKPEEILLLSFTERTVADLRRRIRNLFRRQLRVDADGKAPIPGWTETDLARIHDLWLHADDLSVHTLHGFCQATLLRDPILHDALLRTELASDRDMANEALEDLLRNAWARDPERLERLCEALEINAKDDWRTKLIRLALNWHPWREDRLEPRPDPDAMPRMRAEAAAALERLRAALADVNAGTLPVAQYHALLPEKSKGNNVFVRVARILEEAPSDEEALSDLVKTFYGKYEHGEEKRGKSKAYRDGFASQLESTRGRNIVALPEWVAFATECDAIVRIGVRFEVERVIEKLRVTAQAAMELRAAFDDAKIRAGLISYDDMPRNLVLALRRDPALAERIAGRYKACIVDEFQDTDPLQWEILQYLCLRDTSAAMPALPLTLVGDPKQAIYAFRGGDLPTYLAARKTLRDLAAQGRAQGFGLEANFRSRPSLIAGLNAVFAQENWFGAPAETAEDPAWHLPADSERVHFSRALAGKKDPDDGTARIILREFSGMVDPETGAPAPKREVERAVRHWIAARIVTLLEGGTPARDIAVLVRKNSEGLALERTLLRRGIPCRIRRRGNMFLGPHADALRLLLDWIDDASDPDMQARILLLPFARAATGDDAFPRGRPAECPPLVARWARLARARRWPEFFDSVLLESGYLETLERESPPDADRFAALARRLGEAGAAPGTTTHALRARFDAWRRGEGEEDDGEGGGAGTADDSVSILTIHTSKGLEFPVVFLAATGDGRKPAQYTLRDPDTPGFRIVLDLKNEVDKARFEQQNHEEDLRLFYVAFTRAADALYVPLLPESDGNRRYGALGGFAADALRAVARNDDTARLFAYDEEPVHDRTLPRTNGARAESPHADGHPDADDLQAATHTLFNRRRRLSSYSRLAHRAATPEAPAPADAAEPVLEDDGTRAQRQEAVPESADESATEGAFSGVGAPSGTTGISATELPPGSAVGTALHALLEHIPFAFARDTASPEEWLELPGHRARVEDALRRESVDPSHAPAAARAIWNALRMPIPDPATTEPQETFRLADLAPADLRHEVEFLLPFGAAAGAALPEGVSWKRSGSDVFLWGFIDLVFRREGRYYLLDWKSNLLPSYDRAAIERSMAQHRYDLQWKLYSIALDRWLASRLPGYDPERHFGGVCYLYLRGASEQGPFSGFATRPTPEELRATYPDTLASLLRGPAEETP